MQHAYKQSLYEQLEAFALHAGQWRRLADASGNETIAVAPFDALQLDLGNLWS